MKKQGQKDREDEKLAMQIHNLKKDKVSKKIKRASKSYRK